MNMPLTALLLASALLAGAAPGLAAPSAEPSGEPARRWGGFSLSSQDGLQTTDVEISSVLISSTAPARPETTWISEGTERVWVAKKRVLKRGALASVAWTDSRACYQLVETLSTLIDLNQTPNGPSVAFEGARGSGAVAHMDGAGLSPAPGQAAAIRLTSGADAPVGLLVKTALEALEPCWTDRPPHLTAQP